MIWEMIRPRRSGASWVIRWDGDERGTHGGTNPRSGVSLTGAVESGMRVTYWS